MLKTRLNTILRFTLIFLSISFLFVFFYTKKTEAVTPWYSPVWQYRKLITIDHTKVSSDQTDFPLLISLTDNDLKDISNAGKVGKSNGGDILFTDSSGTNKLIHELESYSNTTGTINAWIKVPALSSTVDTVLYIYFGNAAAGDQWETDGSTWSSNYQLVQHLSDATSTTVADSTGNRYTGTKKATGEPLQTTGKVVNGQAFDGADDYINAGTPTNLNISSNLTLEAWVKPNAGYGETAPRVMDKGKYLINMDTTGRVSFFLTIAATNRSVSQVGTIPVGSWTHIVATFDSTLGSNQLKLYINGTLNNQATAAGTIDSSAANILFLADSGSTTRALNGALDEIRISNSTRSTGWITTQYNNQNSPSTFYTISATEDYNGGSPVVSWYNTSWNFRKAIVIDHTKVTGADQTNFPVLVSAINSEWKDLQNGGRVGKSNGGDILFTDSSGNKLSHDIEKYVNTTGELVTWVKIPSLSATLDTVIYMYYGNPLAIDQSNSGAVWNNNYAMVHHMSDSTTGSIQDSTLNANNGTKLAVNEPIVSAGKIGNGQNFDGQNDNVTVANSSSLNISNAITIEAWVNPNAGYGEVAPRVLDNSKYIVNMDTTGRISFFISVGGVTKSVSMPAGTGITANTWTRVTATFDNSLGSNQMKLYVNGSLNNSSTQTGPIDAPTAPLYIGDSGTQARVLNGSLDEVRVSNIARDSNWIATSYNNQNNPSSFYTFLNSECDNNCTPTAPLNPQAIAGNAQVSLSWTAPEFNGSSALTDYSIQFKTGANAFTTFNDGVSTVTAGTVTGLSNGITYDFQIAATSSVGTGPYTYTVSAMPVNPTPVVPQATNVLINGTPAVGQILTGSYTFVDENGDTQGTSLFQWYRSSSPSGPFSAIPGANSQSYIVSESDNNNYLKFEVTPVSVNNPTNGSPVQSSATSQITSVFLNQILSTGQSLSLGSHGTPALTTTQPYNNKTLSGTNLVPLVESGNETISSSMANFITGNIAGNNYDISVTRNGVGGTGYAGLKKGTVPYQTGLDQITTVKAAATAAGQVERVIGVTNIHGEANNSAAAGVYKGYLVEWQNDYNNDIKAITGQAQDIPMFTDQMGSFTALGTATSNVPIDQLAASEENPGKVILVGPKYFLTYSTDDGVHLTNTSYRLLGEYYGKVIKKVQVDGGSWKPLSPETITRSGRYIYAKFHVPSGPLQLDTTNVLAATNYGFEYTDGSGSPPSISNVEVVSLDTVKITLSAEPIGANQRLRYAYTGTIGSFAGANYSGSARGNLRDSDNTPSQYGNNLYNWAVHFDKEIISDSIAPTGTVQINANATITNSSQVILSLTANDNAAPSNDLQIQISNTNDFTGITPQSFANTINWNLVAGDGTKQVYIRLLDPQGNISSVYSATITLDTTPPSGWILINNGLTVVTNRLISLNINATDLLSGVASMVISESLNFSGVNFTAYSTVAQFLLSSQPGLKTIYIQFKDNAGNLSQIYSTTVTLNLSPSTTTTPVPSFTPTNIISPTITLTPTETITTTVTSSPTSTSSPTEKVSNKSVEEQPTNYFINCILPIIILVTILIILLIIGRNVSRKHNY